MENEMTRFNPKATELDASAWSEIAARQLADNNSQFSLFAGLGVAALVAASANPISGLLVAGWVLRQATIKAKATQANLQAVVEVGCVAHVLEGTNFRRFLNQVGHDAVMAELNWALGEGLQFSDDAIDYFEDSTQAPVNVNLLPTGSGGQTPLTRLANKFFPQAPNTTVSEVEEFSPLSEQELDIIASMSDRVSNSFILGIAGAGKGMLIANALRAIKQKHPNMKIFYVDPKNDPKEHGYIEGVADEIKRYACETEKPEIVCKWLAKCFKEFDEYASKNERTLLVLDDGTVLGLKSKIAKSTILIDRLSSLTSLGDSAGKNVYFVAQTPFVGGSGIDLSASSQLVTVALVSSENKGSLNQWKRSAILKKLNNLDELIDNSPVQRAIYFGKTDKWYSMSKLTNYSGYDRDNRVTIDEQKEDTPNPEFSDMSTKIQQLENIFNQQTEVDDVQDGQVISDILLGQIIEIITNSTTHPVSFNSIRIHKAWRRDYDTSNPGTKVLRDALTKLVSDKRLNGNENDGYSLTNIN